MNVDKAIGILQRSASDGIPRGETAFNDAVKLGIEALRRVEDMRVSPCTTADEILPGETPE